MQRGPKNRVSPHLAPSPAWSPMTSREGPGRVRQSDDSAGARGLWTPQRPAWCVQGTGEARAEQGPARSQQHCPHPLTVPGVQSEPQGDGAALPPGDGLHSVRVLGAGGESHGPPALGPHLCLKAQGAQRTCLQKRLGVLGPTPEWAAPGLASQDQSQRGKATTEPPAHLKAPPCGEGSAGLSLGDGTRTHLPSRSWHPVP